MTQSAKPLAVITGASSGIGAAIARSLSNEGHPLLLLARRADRLEALGLPDAMCRAVDVTDTSAVIAAIDEAEAAYGPVDLLVNNAGVMLLGALDAQDTSEWQQMFNVNVLALLGATQAVLSRMKARNLGTIMNVSSIAGKKTFPNHAAYTGSKFAVTGITENLREEVADSGVRVMAIYPGAVETELLSHTSDEKIVEDYESWKNSMGGVLVADDVARAAIFMYVQPQGVNIRDITIAATRQPA
ncbi:SDR family oxidoreductase [Tritonibacter mobilis]|uniref:SDR family oxidoreductase n=1 Tax=Tritonibacter mobilis TaxID=379347 RepID=UPI00080683E6|nr:SDR family oxidoreductase [Tritonibacter mobilis]MCA2009394.1 SDR family oxidoreductase [Tritonibacter mobilis]MCZ4270132.1 SDR family oxidoreductase [Rhodobacteraceae bacterium G21628-S1]NKX29938.1 SDR family oxidoreductase [Rhodobacteraceae bacterium R_SAG6]NKX39640.1 SDR family oxidoreductase [Rhodobacteraceae bacterium R_SAG5]